MALVTFTQFTASFPIVSYAVIIFKKSGTVLNPYVSSIIAAVSFLIGSLHTTYLIEILGRKWLTIVSLMGAALALFSMSLYLYLKTIDFNLSGFAWFPTVCLSLVIFLSSAGITPVSIICSVEYLPSKVLLRVNLEISVLYSNIFAFSSDSNIRNDIDKRRPQHNWLRFGQNVSDFNGNGRSSWMSLDLRNRLCCWRYFYNNRSERNSWQVT